MVFFPSGLQVMQEIMDNNIRIYSGEIDEDDDTPEIKELRVMGVAYCMGVVCYVCICEGGYFSLGYSFRKPFLLRW